MDNEEKNDLFELDMKNKPSPAENDIDKSSEIEYELYNIISHEGNQTESGHYVVNKNIK